MRTGKRRCSWRSRGAWLDSFPEVELTGHKMHLLWPRRVFTFLRYKDTENCQPTVPGRWPHRRPGLQERIPGAAAVDRLGSLSSQACAPDLSRCHSSKIHAFESQGGRGSKVFHLLAPSPNPVVLGLGRGEAGSLEPGRSGSPVWVGLTGRRLLLSRSSRGKPDQECGLGLECAPGRRAGDPAGGLAAVLLTPLFPYLITPVG